MQKKSQQGNRRKDSHSQPKRPFGQSGSKSPEKTDQGDYEEME
jgi:hypothetical protein